MLNSGNLTGAAADLRSAAYRPDIDGLRAVAVLPVVLYHAGVPAFSGGYVGVDVFFVISGYLITRIILDEIEQTNRFSLIGFYERRVRRIMPAFIAMVAATAAAAGLLFLPRVLEDFGSSAVAASLFSANIYFWKTAGYFTPAADRVPLLHTWSLAVEEQFYIFYPLFLLSMRRWLPKTMLPLLALGTVVSFVMCVLVTDRSPPAAFYLTPFRGWELGLGALISFGAFPPIASALLRTVTAALGLGMIVVAVFTYSDTTAFPGTAALLPCLGAALLIHSGQSGPSAVSRLLSLRVLVGIGLISYSLYLWHWPLFLFAKYAAVRDLTMVEQFGLIAMAFAVSVASWRYVEMPFRRRTALRERRRLFAMAAAATATLVVCGAVIKAGQGLPWRIPADIVALDRAGRDPNFDGSRCHDIMEADIRADRVCRIGDLAATGSWMVWGDSQAWALKPAVEVWMRANGESGWISSRGGCPPLVGVVRRGAPPCLGPNAATLDFVRRHNVKQVLLVAAWPGYPSLDLSEGSSWGYSTQATAQVLDRAVDRTLSALSEIGVRTYVFDWVPGAKRSVPDTLSRARYFGRDVDIKMTLSEYRSKTRVFDELFARNDRLIAGHIKPALSLCPNGTCEILTDDGIPLYADANHPSSGAADVFAAILQQGYARRASGRDVSQTADKK